MELQESPYQKETPYNKHLPYSDCLDGEASQLLVEIKLNLGRAVALRELSPGGLHWCNRLFSYIRLYGYRFTKEDHVLFVKLTYELLIAVDMDSQLLTGFTHILLKLLKKRELLSRDDLVLPWKPLYEIYEFLSYSKFESVGLKIHSCLLEDLIKQLVRTARVYFSDDATQEMLDEWRPLMCPFDVTFAKAMQYFSLFLPTTLPPEKHEKGFKLWFDELIGFWDSCHNSPSWEQFCVKLFARVAKGNIGYIDWKPFVAKIFTRVMRSFSLPIGNKSRSKLPFRDNYDVYVSAVWIVSMMGGDESTQSHLDNFFDAVKSFYHPSNIGKYTSKLQQFLSRLSKVFTERIHRERYKKPSWETAIPASVQLSDDDITKFVECLKPAAMLSMFNKLGSFEAATCLKHLAQLKPEIVLPALLDRTYMALDTLTEPHQLTATLACLTSVAKPLLSSYAAFPDGPTHLIRLLTLVLPGIDANDFMKAMSTFTFISTLTSLVPLVDCSQAVYTMELTETEKEICAASGQFEDFVLLFMERCFAMIENCQFHQTSELNSSTFSEKLDTQEGLIGMGLTSTFHTTLMQCSPQIFKVALQHLFQFCTNKIFETKVAGQMVADFCRAASRTDATSTLNLFVPYIHSVVKNIMSVDGVKDEEEVDEELVWCLQILSEVVRCNGLELLAYKNDLLDIIKPCIGLKCKRAFQFSSKILHHLIPSLVLLYPLEWKSSPVDFGLPPEEYLFIKDWGKSCEIDDLAIQWHIPSVEEKIFAKEILDTFLQPVLNKLTQFTKGNQEMTRDELQHNVDLVHHILQGCCGLLPGFDGPHVDDLGTKSLVSRERIKNTVKCGPDVPLGDDNTRNNIAQKIHDLLVYVLANCEDDTKTLFTIIKIYKALLLQCGVGRIEFDVRWKSARAVKRAMGNKLCYKKKHIRALLVERIQLQHEMRILDDRTCQLTALQKLLFADLFSLSTSVYTQVRIKAQKVLSSCFETYIYAARAVIEPIVAKLKPDSHISHEEFKGALYVLLNVKMLYLMTHYWEIIEKIWLVVVQAEHSEKPSITTLIDTIAEKINRKYDGVAICRKVSDNAIESALSILKTIDASSLPSQDEVNNGIEVLRIHNEENLRHYHSLVETLVSLVNSDDLRWRFSQISSRFLALLVRYDVSPPPCLVKLVTKNLIHDSLAIRKMAITSIGAILKLQKRPHVKVLIDPYSEAGVKKTDNGVIQAGDRPDNYWLHYVKENLPRSEQKWNQCQFVDKTHWGYYTWPKTLFTYAPCDQQPQLDRERDDLSEGEREIFDMFSDKEFVDKFMSYLSLEDRKGKDKFSVQRFVLFKGLFRNFGDTFLHLFEPHLKKLSGDSHESNQRCAAEITAGLIRGSKHWTYSKLEHLWDFVITVIKNALDNITTETIRDWGTCMATAAESRDPRRIFRLLDVLMDDPLNGSGGAFADSSRLYVLQGALAQQEWRVAELLHDLLKYIEPKLGHSYKNVRDRLGSVTCNILMCDIKLARGTPSRSPRVVDFIKAAIPQLCELKDVDLLERESVVVEPMKLEIDEDKMEVDELASRADISNDITLMTLETSVTNHSLEDGNDKRKTAIKLSKTVLNWLWSNSARSLESCPSELFELLPLIVPLESQEDDQELQNLCSMVLAHLSYCLLSSEALSRGVLTIKKIAESPSWHSRKSILTFLQGLVCGNFFMVIADSDHVVVIQTIVLDLLSDKQLEVREAASQTLSGLIHYGFFKVDKCLQEKFAKMAATKLPKKRKKEDDGTSEEIDLSSLFVRRHAGVLGLSSCIQAFPYDVPEWMPQMLVELGEHLHDPNPIQTSVKKVLSNFRRTHHDNWTLHKQQFSEDQLLIFTDLLVSPCYYA